MIRIFNKMDKSLLLLTIVMFVFGLFMILDASSMKSFLVYGENTKYFSKQLITLVGALIVSIFVFCTPLKRYRRLIYLACAALIFMLIALLVAGLATNGSKSWFFIAGFGVQPSEFAKVVLILFTALYYQKNIKRLDNIVVAAVPVTLGAIFTLLTLLQPDGGTGLILFFITVLLFYSSPVSNEIKKKATILGLSIAVFGLLVMLITGKTPLSSMQQGRFNYKKPCTRYQEETGYQVCNGYIAINNGKLFSIQPGNSKQKYLYLPEAYTDFIFPIIVEDMGLITGVIAILIYAIIIIRILVISQRSCNLQNSIICYGVACYIALHVIINLTGVLGLLPLTGVPLPFLSYGGSFALTLAIGLALVQRVSIENYNFNQKKVLK
ncbi:MAG: FtsW/RodA/SpoVE family cell cycle protein [Bacilli bacterium]|nr:FtsW/RodA/SpoVE family cell cycle protein [Bacilli bacterium]